MGLINIKSRKLDYPILPIMGTGSSFKLMALISPSIHKTKTPNPIMVETMDREEGSIAPRTELAIPKIAILNDCPMWNFAKELFLELFIIKAIINPIMVM